MSLNALLQNAIKQGIAAAGDTAISVTYKRVTLGAYDPATDALSVTTSDTTFTTFLYGLKDNEVDWFAGDLTMRKAIVNHADLGFVPTAEDWVEINGEAWEIKSVKAFPGTTGYILFLRKT